MSSMLPIEYYENEENHGSYVYETLENMVNNFMQIYTGDNTLLGITKRSNVLYWFKKGIQQFTFDALREQKTVELELGDALNVILPPDFVQYVKISWLDINTGALMVMGRNRNITITTSYLQDHNCDILFDNNGEILEGTSAVNKINDSLNHRVDGKNIQNNLSVLNNNDYYGTSGIGSADFKVPTVVNGNGVFIIDTRKGVIHFSSFVSTKIIILEYISDGLEYSSDSDIKINKFAEQALYNWVNWNMLNNRVGVPMYEKTRAKKDYDTSYRNAKIRLMNLNVAEVSQMIKARNTWIK